MMSYGSLAHIWALSSSTWGMVFNLFCGISLNDIICQSYEMNFDLNEYWWNFYLQYDLVFAMKTFINRFKVDHLALYLISDYFSSHIYYPKVYQFHCPLTLPL